MNIAVLTRPYPPGYKSDILTEIGLRLSERGGSVDLIQAESKVTALDQIRIEHDLYILKGGDELAFSLAGAYHGLGARFLNSYPACVVMRDKIVATRILEAAGIPTPPTYVTRSLAQLRPLLGDGPLVVKPHKGSQGRGVRVIRDPEQLVGPLNGDGPVFAQRYKESEGFDRKIYCIDQQVFGVERIWPARTKEEKRGKPFRINPALRDIALRCGRALGVDIYGIDVIISNGEPYVVDASSFPGFKGVPNAAELLAEYICSLSPGVARGKRMSRV